MGAKILVLEDDESMRELLRLHLCNAGYEVLEAEDAVVAGHLVLQQRPDLLLADIEMPYMTGLELVRAMRSDPATAKVPVVFLTSRTDADHEAKELGAVGYLLKPLRVDQLMSEIAKHLAALVPKQGKRPDG